MERAVNLVPVPNEPERASCANCSAPLAGDQRYCLACGQPVTPVRLAFLDVLQADAQPYAAGPGAVGSVPAGYAPVIEPSHGADGWIRRYSGLFGLLSVLLMAIIAGLLVGHWITQSKAPAAPQVVKVEGLSAGTAPAPGTPGTGTSATSTSTPPAASSHARSSAASKAASLPKTSAKTEASEAKEAKAIEKAPPPKVTKVNSTKLKKLGATSGKKHEEEINSLGAQPIETGGG
jgi:hypothetical protein